jgi:hypothetical protein
VFGLNTTNSLSGSAVSGATTVVSALTAVVAISSVATVVVVEESVVDVLVVVEIVDVLMDVEVVPVVTVVEVSNVVTTAALTGKSTPCAVLPSVCTVCGVARQITTADANTAAAILIDVLSFLFIKIPPFRPYGL